MREGEEEGEEGFIAGFLRGWYLCVGGGWERGRGGL